MEGKTMEDIGNFLDIEETGCILNMISLPREGSCFSTMRDHRTVLDTWLE